MTENTPPNDSNENHSAENSDIVLQRRKFMQAAGATAAHGLLTDSASGAAASDEFRDEFANRRVQEAKKAWVKGFRGQPNRTLGIIADGLEARHPDLGPWNGIRAIPDGDEGLKLIHENLQPLDASADIRYWEASIRPNAGNVRHEYPFSGPSEVDRVEAHLFAAPSGLANELLFLLETADGDVIDKYGGISRHSAVAGNIDPGEDYVFAVETTANKNFVAQSYEVKAQYFTDNPDGQTDPFANVDRGNVTAETPKVVGWYNEDFSISGPHAKPRTGPHLDGHGTFMASVMGGSGRASAIDETTVTVDSPQEVLLPGDVITYEVQAEPDRGVYGVAFGESIRVVIFDPEGRELGENHLEETTNRTSWITEVPTVHDTGTKTYKVEIRPEKPDQASKDHSVGRVRQVSVGAFKAPDTTAGDRTDEGENPTMHAGVAPNVGLVGLSGWLKTRKDMQRFADDFASLFNLRVLAIKLGFGKSLGIIGGKSSDGSVEAMKALAEAGILPVSRTANTTFVSARDRSAAGADEAISVVQTGPWDGILSTEYNEPAALDEDGQGVYRKPDVVAIGGKNPDTPKAAFGGDGLRAEHEQAPIRDYSTWAWYGAEIPFVTGTAGLVAQALEEEAPAGIALPPPEDAGFIDTMRLKQTILATASETPFTAAPWHRHEPTYDFGGHDPIEGWGRVNIDAAVEAAARDLTPPNAIIHGRNRAQQGQTPEEGRRRDDRSSGDTTTNIEETAGLKLPRDSRAVAGHIAGEPAVYEVTVDFSRYTGDDKARTGGPPHLDLFIYNAEKPTQHGTPNIVTKAQGLTGAASVHFEAGQSTSSGIEGGTYYVVVKLVDVPGAYNSLDIQAHFNLSVKHLESRSGTMTVSKATASDKSAFFGG